MKAPTVDYPRGPQTRMQMETPMPTPLPTPRPGSPWVPELVYSKASSSHASQVLNASISAANHTIKNASQHATATMHNVTAALMNASSSSSSASASNESAAWPAPNTTRHVRPGQNVTATSTSHGLPFMDDLNKMTTTSFTERVSQLSLVHLFAWLLLVVTMMVTTIVLLNWFLRSRQETADRANGGDSPDAEEMHKKAGASEFSVGSTSGGFSSGTSSSSRLLASRGNLARQQFLESRKVGGAAAKDYGATAATSAAH